jgi:putative transcriptional regulator
MRNMDGERSRSLAGSLLVAHPNMLDPNFRRTVLFISAHDPDDGALGVIINRPLDRKVGELVTEAPPENLADIPVFFGGPVDGNQLMFAAFEWYKGKGLRLNHNLLESGDPTVRSVADKVSVRAFLGYAGWSAGQLEAEMKQNSWITQKPSLATLKPERLPRLWFDIMKRLGPWYRMLAAAPDDPSLN